MPIVLPFLKSKFKDLFGEELGTFYEHSSNTGAGDSAGGAGGAGSSIEFLKLYKKCNNLDELTIELKYRNPIIGMLETIAILHLEDVYEPEPEKECLGVFGSTDTNHPYIEEILNRKSDYFYLGGKVVNVQDTPIIHYDFYNHRHSPKEIREYISFNNYKTILGFQTRNPMHNCHYELTKRALEDSGTPITGKKLLLLQPIVGVTQPGDIDYRVRVRCYQHLLKQYILDGIDVKLCLIPLSMRMAGPREALWHALIRKNYGCTNFVVGRDHAGPSMKKKDGSDFYDPYAAHAMIRKYESEIGIKVTLSKMLVYNATTGTYMEIGKTPDNNNQHISGTELRRRLRAREEIPDWFTMPEIARELHRYYSPFIHSLKDSNGEGTGGVVFYFVGLSGAGKSTTAYAFAKKLEEIYDPRIITVLDGDEFRTNISAGLGYSKEDRSIHVRRMGYVAERLARAGGIVLCANIAPFREDRDFNRSIIEKSAKYIEVYVRTSLAVCESRDVKGLYKKARSNIRKEFTGISSPFEEPINPELSINGDGGSKELNKTLTYLLNYLLDILH